MLSTVRNNLFSFRQQSDANNIVTPKQLKSELDSVYFGCNPTKLLPETQQLAKKARIKLKEPETQIKKNIETLKENYKKNGFIPQIKASVLFNSLTKQTEQEIITVKPYYYDDNLPSGISIDVQNLKSKVNRQFNIRFDNNTIQEKEVNSNNSFLYSNQREIQYFNEKVEKYLRIFLSENKL
jgi:hypothetical protein